MGYKIYTRPKLKNPLLIASWPGIGNIGLIAVDYLRQQLSATLLAEIEPWYFFYPNRVIIKSGILEDMRFPSSRFYYARLAERDVIIFIGEEQPYEGMRRYAEGERAYDLANQVLDVAFKFGCKRIYSSGAAVALIHHSTKPKVWAVPNSKELIREAKGYENAVLMSDIHSRKGQGAISGLNGLLLGVARERGLDGMCLMGEIPVYLQGMFLPYPKASKSVLEVLLHILGISIDFTNLDGWSQKTENRIDELLEEFNKTLPAQLREGIMDGLDKLREKPDRPGQLTEEDAKKAISEIEKFFRTGGKGDEEKPL